jgi:spoIIIJ-associated protein
MDTEQIQNLIKDLIEKIAVGTVNITVAENKGTDIWFSVRVVEPHFFIEQDGEALHALNHVVRRIVESKHKDNQPRILIDINDFQKRRVENIRAVAHMMSERARYFKSNIEVDPMRAFDRRIIHEFLSDAPDLKTESVGFGPTRRVVIKYIGTL